MQVFKTWLVGPDSRRPPLTLCVCSSFVFLFLTRVRLVGSGDDDDDGEESQTSNGILNGSVYSFVLNTKEEMDVSTESVD